MTLPSSIADAPNTRRRHLRTDRLAAFALVEIALVVVLLAGALAATAAAYRYALTRAQVDDTRALLVSLLRATQTLQQVDTTQRLDESNGQQVLDALCAYPTTAELMSSQSEHLWRCADGVAQCVDSWGTPLRFIAASETDDTLRRRLQLAGGDAVFESAGPDRDFGDRALARQTDNLRSDEPAPRSVNTAP